LHGNATAAIEMMQNIRPINLSAEGAENAEKFKLEIEDYAALSARSAVVYFF
jgi:hypothetical protein